MSVKALLRTIRNKSGSISDLNLALLSNITYKVSANPNFLPPCIISLAIELSVTKTPSYH